MPDENDNLTPNVIPPSRIERLAEKCARVLERFTSRKDLNRILAIVVSTCIAVASVLLKLSLWLPFEIVSGIGALAFLWLVLRFLRHGSPKPIPRSLVIMLIVLSTCGFFIYRYFHNRTTQKASRFHDVLKKFGLPPELYDYQNQLDTLTIDQTLAQPPFVGDLQWLDSNNLKNLTILSPGLVSLDGLAHVNGLESLETDLTRVPVASFNSLSLLKQLGNLKLSGLTTAKFLPNICQAFPGIAELHLHFLPSELRALPSLATCDQLQTLTLTLRSTTGISQPIDLSQLLNIQTVTVFADNSSLATLGPLAGSPKLQTLKLSLNGDQLSLLSTIPAKGGPEILDITLTSSANSDLPDLHSMDRLSNFILRFFAAVDDKSRLPICSNGNNSPPGISIPHIPTIPHLEKLTISLNGANTCSLPPLENLNGLVQLHLFLASSSIVNLPDISVLKNLQRLTLDIRHTTITQLPAFTLFSNLTELHLLLDRDEAIHSLGIEGLSKLETLELDIRGREATDKIADLASIVKLINLKKLILHLRWEQLTDLPNLNQFSNLETLEIHVEGASSPQDFSNFTLPPGLQQFTLNVHHSPNIKKLPDLVGLQNLWKITLNLDRSGIENLSALENVKNLKELELSLVAAKHLQQLPDLRNLRFLEKVTADISYSGLRLDDTKNLSKLQELTVENRFPSLTDLPATVTKLHFKEPSKDSGSE